MTLSRPTYETVFMSLWMVKILLILYRVQFHEKVRPPVRTNLTRTDRRRKRKSNLYSAKIETVKIIIIKDVNVNIGESILNLLSTVHYQSTLHCQLILLQIQVQLISMLISVNLLIKKLASLLIGISSRTWTQSKVTITETLSGRVGDLKM